MVFRVTFCLKGDQMSDSLRLRLHHDIVLVNNLVTSCSRDFIQRTDRV